MADHRDIFRPLVPPRNLKDELIDCLTAEIKSGALKPSDKLPTEQKMIAAFGVSRTVVREALAALRAEGLIDTRQGVGAFAASSANIGPSPRQYLNRNPTSPAMPCDGTWKETSNAIGRWPTKRRNNTKGP